METSLAGLGAGLRQKQLSLTEKLRETSGKLRETSGKLRGNKEVHPRGAPGALGVETGTATATALYDTEGGLSATAGVLSATAGGLSAPADMDEALLVGDAMPVDGTYDDEAVAEGEEEAQMKKPQPVVAWLREKKRT